MKLTNYIDLYKRLYDQMPDDLNLYVRSQADIPVTMKEQILPILEKKGYNEQPIPNPTMLKSQIRETKE